MPQLDFARLVSYSDTDSAMNPTQVRSKMFAKLISDIAMQFKRTTQLYGKYVNNTIAHGTLIDGCPLQSATRIHCALVTRQRNVIHTGVS